MTVPPPHDHVVQFYEDDACLMESVADFLATGMLSGQSIVVIATDAHREVLTARLEGRGLDVDGACFRGRLLLLDAEETLGTFMVNGGPDPDLFDATVGSAIEKRLRAATSNGLRAYGEMVDVLWKAGNAGAALALEELWNTLAHKHSFALLCAYSMGNFYRASDMRQLHEVCVRHSRVVPVETFTTLESEEARTREIARLQQQARALETEVAERRKLEAALRAAIATQKETERALRRALGQ